MSDFSFLALCQFRLYLIELGASKLLDLKSPCVSFLSTVSICSAVVIYLVDFDHKKLKCFIQDMPQARVKLLCDIYITMGLSGLFANFYRLAKVLKFRCL